MSKRKMPPHAKRNFYILIVLLIFLYSMRIYEEFKAKEAMADIVEPTSIMELHVIDVGQGSSALIRVGDKTVLVDSGESDEGDTVVDYLKAVDVDKLDLVIITHWHADHYGGIEDVIRSIDVERIIAPKTNEELLSESRDLKKIMKQLSDPKYDFSLINEPISIDLSVATLEILGPFLETVDDLNETSLAVRVDANAASFLITGDLEGNGERSLVDLYDMDIDVLVAGHHGSATSSTTYFLGEATPIFSAVSAGVGNQYGLPEKDIIDRLSIFGPVYRTDINSNILFFTDGETIGVKPKAGRELNLAA